MSDSPTNIRRLGNLTRDYPAMSFSLYDQLRFEEENERQVNHHGRTITVGGKEEADKERLIII